LRNQGFVCLSGALSRDRDAGLRYGSQHRPAQFRLTAAPLLAIAADTAKIAGKGMADSDTSAQDTPPVSALRRRREKARAERAARLAANLRANIGRRKQQARDRTSGEAGPVEPEGEPPVDGGA
jgi:hypothetical protein